MNLKLSSLFCCLAARKPARSQQTPPPGYAASSSETDRLLDDVGSPQAEGSEAAHYQRWVSRQHQKWQQANTSQDFDTWLEERHQPYLDEDAWEEHQTQIVSRRAREAHYNRPRPGRRINRLG